MPKGPKGEKRPADAVGLAVMIGKIATGEIADNPRQCEANSKKKASERRAENENKSNR